MDSLPQVSSQNAATLGHLASYAGLIFPVAGPFLVPIALMMLYPEDGFVRDHAVEELNFQISIMIVLAVAGAVTFLASFFCLGFLMFPLLMLLALVPYLAPIPAAVAASRGEAWRYPMIMRFIS